jgi:hypothetical protein
MNPLCDLEDSFGHAFHDLWDEWSLDRDLRKDVVVVLGLKSGVLPVAEDLSCLRGGEEGVESWIY